MKIRQDLYKKILEHAKKEAPLEACGYLAGKDGVVLKSYALTNVDQSEDHFSFDPKEQFSTVKETRKEGLDLLAVYHSHPATPARPSNEDIRLAFDPSISYVIVSLAQGKPEINAYNITRLKDEAHSFPEADRYDMAKEKMVVTLKDNAKQTVKYLIQKEDLETV